MLKPAFPATLVDPKQLQVDQEPLHQKLVPQPAHMLVLDLPKRPKLIDQEPLHKNAKLTKTEARGILADHELLGRSRANKTSIKNHHMVDQDLYK